MRKAEIVTAIILGILSLCIMWKSGEAPAWDPTVARFDNIGLIDGEGPGSGFWPFWLSFIMFICCIWIGINWYRRTSPPSQSDAPFLDSSGKHMLLFVGGGLIGFLLVIYVLGFYGAIPLFLIYYMRFLGNHTWKLTGMISVGMPVFCFFFFDIAMRIVLPKGYLEPLFIPLYEIFL
ncbi:MAG: tripartite tricarboxylate transporter TctB family protein [Kordiimonadaceae bacterium]|jgi:putative tricarboxylic transport membrane protein|nr:tripartite tricarboxylate transporter TctB family protein [Kordiimonadaceae bacterium]MBT6037447.1 tripartite tricarboxylate transporter TctB family protein [Kordiimonadaceae bacterium]MBT6330105.1 tripartite tricarboxylate transporter TctB family protein [Kordiimonadaceae bacterium]MBT7582383.1 tripartite tricarboxylate transporter TctB family protein [Kordiimonadaceae bacterium]